LHPGKQVSFNEETVRATVTVNNGLFKFTSEHRLNLVKEQTAACKGRWQFRELEVISGAPIILFTGKVLLTVEVNSQSDVVVGQAA
jgi:hypothetical protein